MKPIKSKKFRAAVFTLIASVAMLSAGRDAKAIFSWPDITAMIFKQALEEAYDAFVSTMVASLKKQAANLLKGRIEALLSGTKNKPLFITNYENFIYASSRQRAQANTNSFFNSINSQASSQLQRALRPGQQAAMNEIFRGYDGIRPNLDQYVQGGPQNVFNQRQGGGVAAFTAAVTNWANTPGGNLYLGHRYGSGQLVVYTDAKRTEAVAGKGYVSRVNKKTNMIDLPGSLVSDLTSFAESLPMQIVAFARSIPEVIGTLAAEMLSDTIQNGISKITKPIDNQLRNVGNQVRGMRNSSGGTSTYQQQIYRGIKFVN